MGQIIFNKGQRISALFRLKCWGAVNVKGTQYFINLMHALPSVLHSRLMCSKF